MRVCDRCKSPDPCYHNMYIGGKYRDMCRKCDKEFEDLEKVIKSIELDFMKNKNLKHIDFKWEDAR